VPHRPASEVVYIGFEHARFQEDGGRVIYASYCQPRFSANSLVKLSLR